MREAFQKTAWLWTCFERSWIGKTKSTELPIGDRIPTETRLRCRGFGPHDKNGPANSHSTTVAAPQRCANIAPTPWPLLRAQK